MNQIIEIIKKSQILKEYKDNPEKVWEILSKETPEEWTLDGVSEQTGEKYKYLSIEVLEFLVEHFFSRVSDEIRHQSVLINGNTATITISVQINYEYGFSIRSKSGTASITVMDNFYFESNRIKFYEKGVKKPMKAAQLLRTATPLCLTEARKNAIKNICNLFGRNLNREVLEYLPVTDVGEDEKPEADEIVRAQYKKAVKEKDEKTIKEIESNFKL